MDDAFGKNAKQPKQSLLNRILVKGKMKPSSSLFSFTVLGHAKKIRRVAFAMSRWDVNRSEKRRLRLCLKFCVDVGRCDAVGVDLSTEAGACLSRAEKAAEIWLELP